jgi:peptidoglycan/xylan/chitin deacetylase (PgdA/CDA1 family)
VKGVVDEIEQNARKITGLTGTRPRYFRSGTAYYDEVAVEVAARLGQEVVGFSILGDAGATYRKEQVTTALLKATPGDIVIMHMNHPEGETAAGVIAAIPELKRRGFGFARLSDYELR